MQNLKEEKPKIRHTKLRDPVTAPHVKVRKFAVISILQLLFQKLNRKLSFNKNVNGCNSNFYI